ncbi:hypothetical protein VD0004_g9258 [Verticillium dahliae]|nr:hypothetical protein VD0004_g9258 [Verticillium dahliae]PNH63007.1 hypothetical protein VD0001_g9283 [Verticillium dahliae]
MALAAAKWLFVTESHAARCWICLVCDTTIFDGFLNDLTYG